MKIQFKKQQYQLDAVQAVVDCFKGQPKIALGAESVRYTIDPGRRHDAQGQQQADYQTAGFFNAKVVLNDQQLLQNIKAVQHAHNIEKSESIVKDTDTGCNINIDVEMETGTGKTYVYIRTIFELNKQYGWNKFIIVVPSIAIREGVYKTLQITGEHFADEFEGQQAKYFVYDSKNLQNLEAFSSSADINIMVINVQAFNATGKDARKIYEELDGFNSRRPIDVIKANNPILIIDEPQKMSAKKTLQSLSNFNPLMILRYSATHKKQHNLLYRLDALDAYNKKLVKKINVRGISVKGVGGAGEYIYCQSILVSRSAPLALLEIEVKHNSGIKRETVKCAVGDNLYDAARGLPQYEGYAISEIDAHRNLVRFANGVEVEAGEAIGDVSESALRRIQIKETIDAHIERERQLFPLGIKVLSLFFIDEVAKYRVYADQDESGTAGEYARMFEEAYQEAIHGLDMLQEQDFVNYLKRHTASEVHKGYFSQDRAKRFIDPSIDGRGETKGEANDSDAYDLILKDKERLLSFEEPVRFIFSHSALREGWDNPNVFTICALKPHNDNETSRRQEVGRGLRLCVNQHGERMDNKATVHQLNILTVVAGESFSNYVSQLQRDILKDLSARPKEANAAYFAGKQILTAEGTLTEITPQMAKLIERYLVKNDYTDESDAITEGYRHAKETGALAPLPDELQAYSQQILELIDSVLTGKPWDIGNGRDTKTAKRNANYDKAEFKALWSRINHKAVYRVEFDSKELIQHAIHVLDNKLSVSSIQVVIERGGQQEETTYSNVASGSGFVRGTHRTDTLDVDQFSQVEYDLIGEVAKGTELTRITVAKILSGIKLTTFGYFKRNPEEFIAKATLLIKEQKASMIVQHLSYSLLEDKYLDSEIFVPEMSGNFAKAIKTDNKHIYDYLFHDSDVEKKFAEDLETSMDGVCVYSKLPRGFKIPTPVGDYNPDWAIAFNEGTVKHIYFVAETKGSMSSLQLKEIEQRKIECANRFFETVASLQASGKVKYQAIDNYASLLAAVKG